MVSTLRRGDRGSEVERLQDELNGALSPSPHLKSDGVFGPNTEAAVLRFQRNRDLAPDGIVGPRTWRALGRRTDIAPSAVSSPTQPQPDRSGEPAWFQIAKRELGVHEDSAPGRHNRRIVEYHSTTSLRADTDEVPWCSSFVNWVMQKSGHRGTGSAAAKSWLEWGRALDRGRLGAIVVIRRRSAGHDRATGSSSGFHVAFWASQSPTHVKLLGGNQGDRVKYSNFALQSYDVLTFRWPV